MVTEVTATSLFRGPGRGLPECRAAARRWRHHLLAEGAPPAGGRALSFSGLRQCPRPCAADGVLLWRARHAPGKLDPALRARYARRSLPHCGLRACALGPRRLRLDDGPLYPAERDHAAGGGSPGDRRAASDVGIRIAFALAVRDQNPVVYGDGETVLSVRREMITRPSRSCSSARRCRRKLISSLRMRSPRSQAPSSTCSWARPACNGVQNRCWKRWPRIRR